MPELLKEKWTQWAALCTTVLAVCAAISALKGGGLSTKVQLLTTKETNAWSYFQSKSIKQHVSESHREALTLMMLSAGNSGVRQNVADRLKAVDADIARYNQEKEQIRSQAESMGKESETYKRHAGFFGLAVMLLQISIMLNSLGLLLKRIPLWLLGVGFGVGGVGYMAAGFLL